MILRCEIVPSVKSTTTITPYASSEIMNIAETLFLANRELLRTLRINKPSSMLAVDYLLWQLYKHSTAAKAKEKLKRNMYVRLMEYKKEVEKNELENRC